MNKNDDNNKKYDKTRPTSCSIDKGEEVLGASCLNNLCDFARDSCYPAALATAPTSQLSELSSPAVSVFKSPCRAGGGMMAAAPNSLGFSLFTPAQWKELERQAMIYKYMMAFVPIPHELLFPISLTSATPNPSSSSFNSPWGRVDGLVWVNNNVMGKDAEPWRCRRTDGKKWRCSRDVAPNQKYCERHLRRGRPRSRKPVESPSSSELVSPLNNRSHNQNFILPQTCSSVSSGTATGTNNKMTHLEEDDNGNTHGVLSSKVVSLSRGSGLVGGSAGPSFTRPFEGRTDGKGLSFEPVVSSSQTTRSMERMMKDQASNQHWGEMKLFPNTACFGSPHTMEDDYESYKSHPHPTCCSEFVVQNKSQRTFIDAWSNSFSDKPDHLKSSTTTLNRNINSEMAVGEGDYLYPNDMYQVQMNIDLFNNCCEGTGTSDGDGMKSLNCLRSNPGSWALSSTPGGPLAEVLRPPMDLAPDLSTSDHVNESLFVSAVANMVASSPSGVIQMKSDSSGTSSSPASTCENMKLKSKTTP